MAVSGAPPTQKAAQDKKEKKNKIKKKQQATTKICCEISKDPHPLSNMGNKKSTHRERKGS